MEKNPYSSLLTINKDMPVLSDPDIDNARDWFDDELMIIGLHSFNPQLITMFKENDELRQFASEVFDQIDLGIHDIHVDTENFEDWLQTHELGTIPVDKVKSIHEGVLSEVWLVEMKEGTSHMYSLNDFKIHNTINIENGYLNGRYGAIPFIGELNI